MKAPLCITLATLLLAPDARAQMPTPFTPTRAPLAVTAQVPANFELYTHDGPTQLVVNPARAAVEGERFAYTTLGSPIALAAVADVGATSWLVHVDNALSRKHSSGSSGSRHASGARSAHTYEGVDKRAPTRLRVATVRPTTFGGIAMGLTAGYRANSTSVFNRNETTTDEGLVSSRSNDHVLRANDAYYVGIELDAAGQGWDVMSSVSYSRLHSENTSDRETYSYGDIEWQERTSVSARPHGVVYEAHASRQALTTGGRLFITLQGHNLTGQYAGIARSFSAHEQVDLSERATPRDASQRQTRVALGFVQAHHDGPLSLSAGMSPYISLHTVHHLITGPELPALEIVKTKRTLTGVVAPLHAAYRLGPAVSVFGGGLLRYTREAHLAKSSMRPDRTDRRSLLDSHSAFYLGTMLRHPTGLAAQVAFNGHATDLHRWTVSLGYHF